LGVYSFVWSTCKLKRLECTALAFTYIHIIQRNIKNCRGKGWYRTIGRPEFLSAIDKPSSIHGWKYQFVFVKKENRDWTILIWNKQGPNKTWNKSCTTPNEREMPTINYFRVVNSVYPRCGRSVKVPNNWLPRRILFDYECFLCVAGLCSAIPPGSLITAHAFNLTFFAFTLLILFCCMQVK